MFHQDGGTKVPKLPLFETHFPATFAVRGSRHELHALAGASQWLGWGWGPKGGSKELDESFFNAVSCIGMVSISRSL
jgi:hypothetical protein